MIDELQRTAHAPRPAGASRRGRARFGPLSLWLLLAAGMLQLVSLVQQLSYLFAPKPGALPLVIAVVVLAALTGFAGVVSGVLGVSTKGGRRSGAFGAALGIAFLVLFAAASSFGWGFLEALSAPI